MRDFIINQEFRTLQLVLCAVEIKDKEIRKVKTIVHTMVLFILLLNKTYITNIHND